MKNIIMAAELGLLSLTQLQKLAQQQQQKIQANLQEASAAVRSSSSISKKKKKNIINKNNNNYNWMWNPKHHQEHQENQEEVVEEEDEDSWEVKAFEQDTTGNNIVTWPPRSYTCTFCRREFRSAQALGGHMNVHRRDRARLHQTLPTPTPTASTSSTALLIPAQEFGGGLCVLYSLPNPNAVNNSCMDSPSTTTVLSISPFEPNNLVAPLFPNPNSSSSNNIIDNGEIKMEDSSTNEELDLELRLGRR